MTFFRRLYRFIAVPALALFYIALSIPYQFAGWKGRKKIACLLQAWAKRACSVMGLRVDVEGLPEGSQAGLVVSNHLSWLDIIVHASLLPLRFTSTTVIIKWPVIGAFIASTHPVLVDRASRPASRKALRDFAKTMKNGIYLIVYPEGTSSDGRAGVLPFKSTSFAAVSALDLQVFPLVMSYAEPQGRQTVCWYGDMTFMPHVWRVTGYSRIDVKVRFLPPLRPEGRTRKDMADHVHDLMDKAYREIADNERKNALYSAA